MLLTKTLRCVVLILLFTGVFVCSGQGVRFQFYRTRACTALQKLDTAYSLYKVSGSIDTDYFPKKGTVYLPGPGRYKIAMIGPLLDTVFNIRDTGLFVFRYAEPDHGLYNTGAVDTPPLYYRCDSLLQGYHEYYYPNGNLQMRGIFKTGYPKDSMVTFYQNGQTKSRMMRYPKVIITTTFDSIGHKLTDYQTQNISFMTYREYTSTAFYPNGKVKKKESSINHVRRLEEYYSNGKPKTRHTKKYRTEYYENGLQKRTYTWTHKRDHILHSNDFTIYRTDFNLAGRVTLKTTYSQGWTFKVDQPSLALKRSDWIISYDKYEGGNKVLSVADISTEDFTKKYPADVDDDPNKNE